MRLKPPAVYYVVVERLHNRRITLRRDESDKGYVLQLETCLSKQDAAERSAEALPSKPLHLRRGRILVTHLVLSNEAMESICKLYQRHEQHATKRQLERNRRQQVIASRLAALEEAALNAELRAPELSAPAPPAPPVAKPPRKPRAKKGEE